MFLFKVPGLRNVAKTAPYMHNGSSPTLKDAIDLMGRIQLDVTLPRQDIALIEAFLNSLTGEYRGKKL
jgi:cytochrome c peroxidase